jgi:hypothetical protein
VKTELWDKVQALLGGNRNKHRQHIRERSSSLLTGLLTDANGNRYTPSFTLKKNRRYRYYVSQLAIKNPYREFVGPIRLPAREIENRVIERLISFLRSDAEVFDQFGGVTDSPSGSQRLKALRQHPFELGRATPSVWVS